MGIRASYWLTGGILTVLGLALGKILLGFLAAIALTVGAVLLKAVIVVTVLFAIWLALRLARGRRPEAGRTPAGNPFDR